jgi:transposase
MLGASVAEVARRHGVNANQVFTWRLQQEQGVLGRRKRGRPAAVKLLPVQVSREAPESLAEASCAALAAPASEGRIEITLADGVRITISGAVSVGQLHPVLSVLRR